VQSLMDRNSKFACLHNLAVSEAFDVIFGVYSRWNSIGFSSIHVFNSCQVVGGIQTMVSEKCSKNILSQYMGGLRPISYKKMFELVCFGN
jgi:hypothetical protein